MAMRPGEYSEYPLLVNFWEMPKDWYQPVLVKSLGPPRYLSCDLGQRWADRREAAIAGPRLNLPWTKREPEEQRLRLAWDSFINSLGAKPDGTCARHKLDDDDWEEACSLAQEFLALLPDSLPRIRNDAQGAWRQFMDNRTCLPEVREAAWRLVDEPTVVQGERILERPERVCQALSSGVSLLLVFRVPIGVTY